jgi:F420-dependent oxidoreductase-like protein
MPNSIRVMKISTILSYSGGFKESARQVKEMESAGLDLVWVAEAYGFDGPSLMGYLAALTDTVEIGSGILPIYTRTPTLIAMTAAGIDALSNGRFNLGLGASGPQVIEGWHGVAYDAPIGRTREITEICRAVWKRESPLVHDGRHYQLPLAEGRGTGLGKPLKIIAHPVRPRIPIWVASLGDKNVTMTAEVADGWLPMMFIPERAKEVWGSALSEGLAKRDEQLEPLMISTGGLLAIGEGEDVTRLRELARPMLALYIGGMGARGRNFYNDLACRYGFEKEAGEIQDLYLSGKKKEAEAAVPDEILELTSLAGPAGWVAERVAALREGGVTHLQVTPVPTGEQTSASLIGQLKQLIA